MLKIGIIGAGTISISHIEAYIKNPCVTIAAICDVNIDGAKAKAEQYSIPKYYSDYKKILDDEEIDAVSIVTPTFTHKNIITEALKAGKHVLCEKPPALNYEEALECEKTAKETGKILMYGFVVRFTPEAAFLKKYISSGKAGEIYYAEASRLNRCNRVGGWFINKEKSGGGGLMDAAIHEVDLALYLMGYPKAKSVKGFATDINKNLPDKMEGIGAAWKSSDVNTYDRTVESFASGYVHFENGACLYIKASLVLNCINEGRNVELYGADSGVKYDGSKINIVSADDTGYFLESSPVLKDKVDIFSSEINHFVNCCLGQEKPISTPEQGTEIMKIITAIYKSAETRKEIVF